MEKHADEALRRKKRRRKVVASSSEDEQLDTGNDVVERPIQGNVEVEPSGHGKMSQPTETAASKLEEVSEPPEPPAEPPAEPPEDRSGRKKEGPATASKTLHAARAWLKAPSRKNDALMQDRCAAMSGLTKKEVADFVEANAKRKPGEWCFTVVDERIKAKKKEQEAIEVATGVVSASAGLGETFLPQPEELAHPKAATVKAESDEASSPLIQGRTKRPVAETEGVSAAQDACVPATASASRTPEPEKADAQTGSQFVREPSAKMPKEKQMESDHPPEGVVSKRRRAKAKAKSEASKAPGPPCELSCLEASPGGRRKFAPLRPGTRPAAAAAAAASAQKSLMALTSTAQPSQPSQPSRPGRGCRHPNVSKTGCAMVCDICGEELLYDGWRLELCDDFDVYNSAG